jgi:hypothetical protein
MLAARNIHGAPPAAVVALFDEAIAAHKYTMVTAPAISLLGGRAEYLTPNGDVEVAGTHRKS